MGKCVMQRGVVNVTLIAAIASAAGGAWAAHWVTAASFKADIAKADRAHQDAVNESNSRATAAGFRYEALKADQKVRVVYITRTVERELAASPDWSRVELPSGLRESLARAATDSGAAEPAAALPAVPAASAGNESGSGLVLRGRTRLGSGLQGATPVPD